MVRYFTLVAVAYEPEIRSLLIMVVPVQVLFDGDRVLPSPKVSASYDARIKLVKKIITCVTACERNSSYQFAVSEFSAYTIADLSKANSVTSPAVHVFRIFLTLLLYSYKFISVILGVGFSIRACNAFYRFKP